MRLNIKSQAVFLLKSPVSLWHLICCQSTATGQTDSSWRRGLAAWQADVEDFCESHVAVPVGKARQCIPRQVSASRFVLWACCCRCRVFPFRTQNSMWFDFMLFYPLTGLITGTGKSNDVCLRVRVCMCENKKTLHRTLAVDPLAVDPLSGCPVIE